MDQPRSVSTILSTSMDKENNISLLSTSMDKENMGAHRMSVESNRTPGGRRVFATPNVGSRGEVLGESRRSDSKETFECSGKASSSMQVHKLLEDLADMRNMQRRNEDELNQTRDELRIRRDHWDKMKSEMQTQIAVLNDENETLRTDLKDAKKAGLEHIRALEAQLAELRLGDGGELAEGGRTGSAWTCAAQRQRVQCVRVCALDLRVRLP